MWYKMSWGLGVLAVVLLIGFSMLIIPAQMELKQIREEAKATEKRLQKEGKHDHEHYHADNGTHAGISDLEQGTETTVKPNNPVNINESGNMNETTETAAVGTGANGEVFRFKDSIYKGMTYPEVVKFWDKRTKEAYQEYKNVSDLSDEMDKTLLNANLSGMSILVAAIRRAPSDIYERALDKALKNEPNAREEREKLEAFMDEVEKHSYSDLDSLEDQLSRFKNNKGYRQMLRETSNELRTERNRLFAEYLKIFEESPRNIRRNLK